MINRTSKRSVCQNGTPFDIFPGIQEKIALIEDLRIKYAPKYAQVNQIHKFLKGRIAFATYLLQNTSHSVEEIAKLVKASVQFVTDVKTTLNLNK